MFKKYLSTIILILFLFIFSSAVSADKLYLNSGEDYSGEVLNEYLEIKNSYAEIRLLEVNLTRVEKRGDSYEITAGDKSKFSGVIIGEALVFDAEGEILTLQNNQIRRIIFENAEKVSTDNKTSFKMKNGDNFLGKLMNKTITIKSSFNSNLEISSEQINKISFNNGSNAVINLKDGKKIDSEITLESFIIKPGAGRIFSVNASNLREISFW